MTASTGAACGAAHGAAGAELRAPATGTAGAAAGVPQGRDAPDVDARPAHVARAAHRRTLRGYARRRRRARSTPTARGRRYGPRRWCLWRGVRRRAQASQPPKLHFRHFNTFVLLPLCSFNSMSKILLYMDSCLHRISSIGDSPDCPKVKTQIRLS